MGLKPLLNATTAIRMSITGKDRVLDFSAVFLAGRMSPTVFVAKSLKISRQITHSKPCGIGSLSKNGLLRSPSNVATSCDVATCKAFLPTDSNSQGLSPGKHFKQSERRWQPSQTAKKQLFIKWRGSLLGLEEYQTIPAQSCEISQAKRLHCCLRFGSFGLGHRFCGRCRCLSTIWAPEKWSRVFVPQMRATQKPIWISEVFAQHLQQQYPLSAGPLEMVLSV